MAVISDVAVEADISAFSAGASEAEHANAVLALAQQLNTAAPQNHLAAYTASLSTHLSRDASAAQRITAFHFLTALALVHPNTAYHILLEPATGLLQLCTAAANIDTEDGGHELAFHFAAMLAAIADWPPSRTHLAGASAAHIHAWAATAVNNAPTTDPSAHTALLAGLLILKLASPNSSSSSATSPLALDPAQASLRRQQATTLAPRLYALAKQEVNHRSSSSSAQLNRPSRTALLAALETLAYLSIFNPDSTQPSSKTSIKDQITSDPNLLKGLVHLALRAAGPQSHDSAVQFTIASIFEHLSAYPVRLSSEQKQVERLRKMAAQKQREAERKAAGAAATSKKEEEEEEDTAAQHAQAEARCTRLLQAGIISALVAMSTSSASASLRTSTSTDESQQQEQARPPLQLSLASTLAALTMRQDRRTRGQIAQQGGARTLLMLSNRELDRYRTSSRRSATTGSAEEGGGKKVGGELNIVPLQALARVCISLDPQLLFGPTSTSTTSTGAGTAAGPIVALPALCTLFLHPSAESDTLARFEAALALTNLSSVHPDLASRICAFSLDTLLGARREEEGKKPTVLEMLDARVFTEDHLMTRRAYVELLCNLVQCEPAYRIWTGEDEDASTSSPGAGSEEGRPRSSAQQGIHILAALCAPADVDAPVQPQDTKESSLPTRLAAAGTLATLCSSPSACERTLCLGIRSLNTLARLLAPVRPRGPSSVSSVGASSGGAIASSDRFTELSKEEAEEEDDDKTAVEHEGGGRETSAGVEVNEDDDGWTMTDAEEVELLEAEDADLESFRPPSSSSDDDTTPTPAAPKLAQAQLAIRGATIANSLLQYLHWRTQQPPSPPSSRKPTTTQLARRLERAGMLDALREEVQGAIGELRLGESAAERRAGGGVGAGEVMGMRREVVRLCLDSLKVWGGLGLGSG